MTTGGTDRVSLRPFAVEHLDATWLWLQDADLRRSVDSTGPAPSREENAAHWGRHLADPARECYAVYAGDRHVGNCGLLIDASRRKAELWLYLGESRGRGIGTRAADLLLDRAFDELALHRAVVRVVSTNPDAERFWGARGFVVEGRLRDDTRVGAAPADSILLGLLAGERPPRAGVGADG